MANHDHHIDQEFHQRFNGLQDHSVSPKTQWAAVESAMNAPVVTGSSATSSGWSHVLVQKIAAGVATTAMVTGVATSERLDQTAVNDRLITITEVVAPSIEPEAQEADRASYVDAVANSSGDVSLPPAPPDVASTQLLASAPDDEIREESILSAHQESTPVESASENSLAGSSDGMKRSARKEFMTLMPILALNTNEEASLVNAQHEIPEPVIHAWQSSHIWYFRGAARVGSGESNSFEIDAEWKVNPYLSMGYGFAITDKSFMAVEIGWLRRSGNGIERTRSIDLDPIISAIANNSNQTNLYETDLVIHESLVATRMDYIHVPVTYNRMFNDRWSVGVGGFADVLIAARNDAYIVYNNTQYKASTIGQNDLSTMKGLNPIRYGAVLGTEFQLSEHIQVSGYAMVPVNGAVDDKSEYDVIDQTNRLIDFQLGMAYRL